MVSSGVLAVAVAVAVAVAAAAAASWGSRGAAAQAACASGDFVVEKSGEEVLRITAPAGQLKARVHAPGGELDLGGFLLVNGAGPSVDTGAFPAAVDLPAAGGPAIAFRDAFEGVLKVALCGAPDCETATVATPRGAGAGSHGQWASAAPSPNGFAAVACQDAAAGSTILVECTNADCSASREEDLDPAVAGEYISLVSSGSLFAAAYYDAAATSVKLSLCQDVLCSAAVVRTLQGPSGVASGTHTSLGLFGAGGVPMVAFKHRAVNATVATVRVYVCANGACATGATQDVFTCGDPTYCDSIRVINDGGLGPLVVFRTDAGALHWVRCADAQCTSTTSGPIAAGVTFREGSVGATAAAGTTPVVTARETVSGELVHFSCVGAPACLTWTRVVVDDADPATYTSPFGATGVAFQRRPTNTGDLVVKNAVAGAGPTRGNIVACCDANELSIQDTATNTFLLRFIASGDIVVPGNLVPTNRCPNGMTDTGSFCADNVNRPTGLFSTHATACASQGKRVCSMEETVVLCEQGIGAATTLMTSNFAQRIAAEAGFARVSAAPTCAPAFQLNLGLSVNGPARCCRDRVLH